MKAWQVGRLGEPSLLLAVGVADNRGELVDPGVDLGKDVVPAGVLIHEVRGDEAANHTDQGPQHSLHVVILALEPRRRGLSIVGGNDRRRREPRRLLPDALPLDQRAA